MTGRPGGTAVRALGSVARSVTVPYRRSVAAAGGALARLGATPNAITAAALAVGIAASGLFVATRDVGLFIAMICGGALLDALDGEVARRRGMTTRLGGYFDALADRLFETAMLFAAGAVSGHWALCFLLLGGSVCVSYAKARVALEIPTRNEAWPDLMERDRRLVAFLAALALWAAFPHARLAGQDVFFWSLVLLNLAVAATLVQRCRRAVARIRAFEQCIDEGPPVQRSGAR